MEITIEIKLLPRIKPVGLDDYKKRPALPVRIRSINTDNMNRFHKQITSVRPDYEANIVWNQEINRLRENTKWKLKNSADFGEMLIGCISCVEFDDFYTEIYLPLKTL